MPAQQVFSLEEVNALVPELTRIVGAQLESRDRIESMLDALGEATGARGPAVRRGEPVDVTPRDDDPPAVRKQKREIARAIDAYHRGWSEVEAMGGVLKDPREGLVDFYGTVAGRLVWLCWKMGETRVNHYHQLDEGFASRKRIEESGRRMMLN
ncbi:MAG TPA: DUF2203 domain-containing protein [Polyangiaceae bacterium]|jgi:hypothetical protein